MIDIALLLVPWAVTTWCMFTLILWDERHLPPDQLARAWPPATRAIAIVYFGVLALPVHFFRTRRTPLGLVQGLAWALGMALVSEGLANGLDELLSRAVTS